MLYHLFLGITFPIWFKGYLLFAVLYYASNIGYHFFYVLVYIFVVSRTLTFLHTLFVISRISRLLESDDMAPKRIAPMMKQSQYSSLPNMIFGQTCPQHTGIKMKEVLDYYHKGIPRRATKIRLLQLLVQVEREIIEGEKVHIAGWLRGRFGKEPLARIIDNSRVDERSLKLNSKQEIVDEEGEQLLPEPQPVRPRTIECMTCVETLRLENFPSQKLSWECNHELMVCNACLTRSIDLQIPEVEWDQVKCPECSTILPFDIVKRHASAHMFERYDRKSVMAFLKDMPNFTMCLGPGCDSGQIHGGGYENPIMTCTSCGFRSCTVHHLPWHTGMTCAEFDAQPSDAERAEQEAASEKLLSETAQLCPGCKRHIQKTSGCDHMTCNKCHHQFCYKCGADYKMINRIGDAAHLATCKWNTNRLP